MTFIDHEFTGTDNLNYTESNAIRELIEGVRELGAMFRRSLIYIFCRLSNITESFFLYKFGVQHTNFVEILENSYSHISTLFFVLCDVKLIMTHLH